MHDAQDDVPPPDVYLQGFGIFNKTMVHSTYVLARFKVHCCNAESDN